MEENKKIAKKRHYDTKLPCPGCGERIGFVESTCPFCDESIPFWSDKAGKIMLSLGAFLALGFLVTSIYFWDKGALGYVLARGFLEFIVFFALAERASRY